MPTDRPLMETEAVTLLPCPNPWCVSHADLDSEPEVRTYWSGGYRVSCDVCPQDGPVADTQAGAADAWNARPPEATTSAVGKADVTPASGWHADELRALIAKATDEDLTDGGRYFSETYTDLTRCRHEEIGEYQNRHDGPLVEWLWNYRHIILSVLATLAPSMSAPSVEAKFLIEERDDDMLVCERDWQWGWRCIARRPKALSNADWRPTAERIIAALSVPTATAQNDDRVKALEEAAGITDAFAAAIRAKTPDGMIDRATDQAILAANAEIAARIRAAALAPVHTADTAQGGVTREAEIDDAIRQAIGEGLDEGRAYRLQSGKVEAIFTRLVAVRDEYAAHPSSGITQGREGS